MNVTPSSAVPAELALPELNAALLLDAGLFNRGHLAFELGQFCGLWTVTMNEERRRPEHDNGHAGGNLIVRAQLARLMKGLKRGDVVVVTKLDRLGRSTRELLDLIDRISAAGASFRSLGDPLWDTGSSQGRLLSTMLAAIAEFERELIRERTGAGRTRAMAAGVKFGRKPKLSDFQRAEAVKRRAAGERLADIAESYAVDISMISRLQA